MPCTGTPSSSSSRGSGGAPSAYTEAGPPESTIPRGRRRSSSSSRTSCGSSSEDTPHSRVRRAISWAYSPPESRTQTSCKPAPAGVLPSSAAFTWPLPRSLACGAASLSGLVFGGCRLLEHLLIQLVDRRGDLGLAVRAHADVLLALKLLALAQKRRRDH